MSSPGLVLKNETGVIQESRIGLVGFLFFFYKNPDNPIGAHFSFESIQISVLQITSLSLNYECREIYHTKRH
jgi:hypothetical protein